MPATLHTGVDFMRRQIGLGPLLRLTHPKTVVIVYYLFTAQKTLKTDFHMNFMVVHY